MIEEPPLLTIRRPNRRPTAAQIDAFRGQPTSFVADAMWGVGAVPGIGPLGFGRDLDCIAVGPALTVDCGPGDLLALAASLEFIQAGDVVVSAFAGHQGCAQAGDRICGMMKNNGAVGFVTDGPMRDYDGLVAAGLPAWCSGLNPNSPVSQGPGRIGLPINLNGVRIETGDMIVADRDGVVVVPFAEIAEVAERLARVAELETALDAKVAAGQTRIDGAAAVVASDRTAFVD
ncbi:MAG: RraA family protein [Pseudomonadota bacterium]